MITTAEIVEVLNDLEGSIKETAKRFGMSPQAIQARIKRAGYIKQYRLKKYQGETNEKNA